MLRALLIAGLAAVAFVMLVPSAQEEDVLPSEEVTYLVTSVIDGDTIKVLLNGGEESVRIIGIDTPEVEECYFQQATKAMEVAVDGRYVSLHTGAQTDRDEYERLLRYVHFEEEDIGASMIEDGYAEHLDFFPHPRTEQYETLEQAAQLQQRGRWGMCD